MKLNPLRTLACWAVLSLVLPASLMATDEPKQLPSWVLLGQSRLLLEQKKFGEAVLLLRQAIARKGVYPEAEAELAKILGLNGDLRLKEKQLERALDQASLLTVPEDRFNLLYELAEVRGLLEKPGLPFPGDAKAQVLLKILEDDQVYQGKQGSRSGEVTSVLASYNRALFEKQSGPQGLDRVLFLHRAELGFSLKAHQELGRLYLENHAYDKAVNHYLFALVGIFSKATSLVESLDRSFTFTNLHDLFNDNPDRGPVGLGRGRSLAGQPDFGQLAKFRPVREYLDQSRTWESLYYLGKAALGVKLETGGRYAAFSASETARGVWELLTWAAPTTSWASLAEIELKRLK